MVFTASLNPIARKEPRKVNSSDTPNQRQSKASKVVKGMAADEPASNRNRLSTKNTPNVIPGTKKAVINTLVFQYRP